MAMKGKPQIAAQMMVFADKVEELGIYETLSRLNKIGYNSFEISKIAMSDENVREMQRAKDEMGITYCSLSCTIAPAAQGSITDDLRDQFDKIVADAKTLDSKYLRIGSIPHESHGRADEYTKYAAELNAYGRRLHDHGLKLFYHHHHYDFERVNGKYLMDILADGTDPAFVGFQLDVHWIHRAGIDIATLIERFAGRIELVHLKDYRVVTPPSFETADDYVHGGLQFAELGSGNFDFVKIIEACERAGVEYLPVEQDNTYGRDPFDSFEESLNHIRKIGYSRYI